MCQEARGPSPGSPGPLAPRWWPTRTLTGLTGEGLGDLTSAPVVAPTEVPREAVEAEADGPAKGAATSRTKDSHHSSHAHYPKVIFSVP